MGSCISHICDDYDTYVDFCKLTNEESVDIRGEFYEHEKELMKKNKYVKDGVWYKKIDHDYEFNLHQRLNNGDDMMSFDSKPIGGFSE